MTTRASAALLEVMDRRGIDTTGLTDGLGVDMETLRAGEQRIDWDTHVRILSRVRERVGLDGLEALGEDINSAPSWEFPRLLQPFFFDPAPFFLLGLRLFWTAVFPCVEQEARRLSDGRIRVSMRTPEGGPRCPEFFAISTGVIRSFPKLMGLPSAEVVREPASEDSATAVFLARMPSRPSPWTGLGRLARGLPEIPSALRGLRRQLNEVDRSYQELVHSRRDFYEVLSRLPVGVVIHRAGRILYTNTSFAGMLGYDHPDELLGVAITDLLEPSYRDFVARRLARMDAGEDVERAEVRGVRRDGGTFIAESVPLRDVDFGGEKARATVLYDVTEREGMRRQLTLADRMASLGTLAAGVAHEINNPLTYLRGSLDIIGREVDRLRESGTDPAVLERMVGALEAAQDGSLRVTTIVSDLKVFSRPDDDSSEEVDLEELLESTLRVVAKHAKTRARVRRSGGPVASVIGSRTRLGQIFLNLVMNAIEAIPEGRAMDHTVSIWTGSDGIDRVVVEVTDDGHGMTPDVVERIFDPFFTTKPGTGTGLGLCITRQLVENMGGEISVHSTPGEGTRMRVSLPSVEGLLRAPSP